MTEHFDGRTDRFLKSFKEQLDRIQRQITEQIDEMRREICESRDSVRLVYDESRSNTSQPVPKEIDLIECANDSPEDIWRKALSIIRAQINHDAIFETWFAETKIERFDSDAREVVIATHNQFARGWLEKRYTAVVQQALYALKHQDFRVKFVVQTAVLSS